MNCTDNSGRGGVMNGRTHRRRRNDWPSTPMADAFLIALGKWVSLHHEDDAAVVVLPTGYVTATELVRVLAALERSRQELHSTQHKEKENYHAKVCTTEVQRQCTGCRARFRCSGCESRTHYSSRMNTNSVSNPRKSSSVMRTFSLLSISLNWRAAAVSMAARFGLMDRMPDAGDLTAENQHLIAQLLTLANLPTVGNVATLIPKLAGLEFDAHLVLAVDNRTGRATTTIADIYLDDAS